MDESLTKGGTTNVPVLSVSIASLPRPGGGDILADIHFSAGKGECLAVIGQNHAVMLGNQGFCLLQGIAEAIRRQRRRAC